MKTSFVSNLAVQNAMRSTIQAGQSEVIKLQQEATTGVHADSGLALGSSTSRAVNLRNELERLENISDTNAVVTQRLSASQLALETMRKSAEEVSTTLTAALGNNDQGRLQVTKTNIQGALSAFTAAANTQFNGEYLMSGLNTDIKPLTDYAAGSPAKAAFTTALNDYKTTNGIANTSDFTVAQMNDFIKNKLEPMYTGAQWETNWSDASSQNIESRISPNERVVSSTNANTAGVRKFALATVLSSELMAENVSSDVRNTINTASLNYVQQSVSALIDTSSTLGTSEARVKSSNTSLSAQVKLVKTHLNDLEGIDVYEATTRMTTLLTQIETSYTLTSRLSQLSLINYL